MIVISRGPAAAAVCCAGAVAVAAAGAVASIRAEHRQRRYHQRSSIAPKVTKHMCDTNGVCHTHTAHRVARIGTTVSSYSLFAVAALSFSVVLFFIHVCPRIILFAVSCLILSVVEAPDLEQR